MWPELGLEEWVMLRAGIKLPLVWWLHHVERYGAEWLPCRPFLCAAPFFLYVLQFFKRNAGVEYPGFLLPREVWNLANMDSGFWSLSTMKNLCWKTRNMQLSVCGREKWVCLAGWLSLRATGSTYLWVGLFWGVKFSSDMVRKRQTQRRIFCDLYSRSFHSGSLVKLIPPALTSESTWLPLILFSSTWLVRLCWWPQSIMLSSHHFPQLSFPQKYVPGHAQYTDEILRGSQTYLIPNYWPLPLPGSQPSFSGPLEGTSQ